MTVDNQPVKLSVASQSGTDWTQVYELTSARVPKFALLVGGSDVLLRRSAKAGQTNPVR